MAPSPTGMLHIGTARTAIFNWLFARHQHGAFVLRIEDTDKDRSEQAFEDDILDGLKWLGLDWDEFYRQSDRAPIHAKYIQKLLDQDKAFWCFHSTDELEKEREQQILDKELPRHVCDYKKKKGKTTKVAKGELSGVIRLAVDENSKRKIVFKDVIRGSVEFEERLLGDFSIARDVNDALYHLAVVVDDYEMNISHIIRGEDHIANTPKQILIQEALGFDLPTYAHVPLILAPDRSKLSKRHGATSLTEYRERGYLPEAILNYLSLLGFTSPTQEILVKEQLTDVFDLAKIHKSGAIFDIKKLNWINGEYIKRMPDSALQSRITPYFERYFGSVNSEYIATTLPLVRERIKKLSDIQEFTFLFKEPEYEKELLNWKDKTSEDVRNTLNKVKNLINEADFINKDALRTRLDELGQQLQDRGLVYWPFRVSLSGQKASPDPIDIAFVIGKAKALDRINLAISKLK